MGRHIKKTEKKPLKQNNTNNKSKSEFFEMINKIDRPLAQN